MELKEPRKKSHCKFRPVPFLSLSERKKPINGYFDGFSVVVKDPKDMQELHVKGCFGKGNLSRSYPSRQNHTEIIRKRVFDRRKLRESQNNHSKTIIVVPDSDSEDTVYFTNLKPEYCIDKSGFKEFLHLSLEEAYFLSVSLKCLNIWQNDEIPDANTTWDLFAQTDKYFHQNYPVYHYFRSKNWIVKSGVKFGGDYLLYKDGPAFHHASYLVIIDVLDQTTLERKQHMVRRSMEVVNMIALNRLCETVGKDLMICQILWPEKITTLTFGDLDKLSISEVIMRRWILSENRGLNK